MSLEQTDHDSNDIQFDTNKEDWFTVNGSTLILQKDPVDIYNDYDGFDTTVQIGSGSVDTDDFNRSKSQKKFHQFMSEISEQAFIDYIEETTDYQFNLDFRRSAGADGVDFYFSPVAGWEVNKNNVDNAVKIEFKNRTKMTKKHIDLITKPAHRKKTDLYVLSWINWNNRETAPASKDKNLVDYINQINGIDIVGYQDNDTVRDNSYPFYAGKGDNRDKEICEYTTLNSNLDDLIEAIQNTRK